MKRRAILLLVVIGAALVLSSGVALAVTRQCKTDVPCYGTKERDKLLGTAGSNFMYGKAANDTLKGFDSWDGLYGQKGNDRLFGGAGGDDLDGGPGRDALLGEEDDDFYRYGANNWGKDTITDTTLSDTDYNTGNTIGYDSAVTTNLTIKLVSDPLSPEAKNADGTSTVNWSGNVIDEVFNSSPGNDQVTGNGVANNIISRNGFDTVYGLGGDDQITVNDGSGGDTVDCGAGTDTVIYDGPTATSLGDTVTGCEDPRPS